MEAAPPPAVKEARQRLDEHIRALIAWHFSPETGCPFWLRWKDQAGWDPREKVRSFTDLLERFEHFQDDWLRDEPNSSWVPKPYQGRPYFVFETGGTTGMPKQRISWEDHLLDYSAFSATLDDEHFPRGAAWLMVGPTGPRRLRLAIEHLAHVRGGPCFFVDLDPRWVVKLLNKQEFDLANQYKDHVIQQAVTILKHRRISCLFTTPKLLEALGERCNVIKAGIKGVFCGGTSMTAQMVRFLSEEVLENQARFVPTYGNTLMGLACSRPLEPADQWSVTYYAPEPRAVLRVVQPNATRSETPLGERGRVELTTLTKELFMPRFLERDEAIRRAPCELYPWDGVGDVRPFQQMEKKVVEGVY